MSFAQFPKSFSLIASCLAILNASNALAQESAPAPKPSVTLTTETKVMINIDHGVVIPEEDFVGFTLSAKGCKANAEMSLYAIGSKGEKVLMLPEEKGVRVPQTGEFDITFPYDFKGLHPGNWLFALVLSTEIHTFSTLIPKIVRPSKDPKTWKADFQAAKDYEASIPKGKD